MSVIPTHAARLPHFATVITLDPIFGPISRTVAELAPGVEILAQSGDALCFRRIEALTSVAAPATISRIDRGALADTSPNAAILLDAQQSFGLPYACSPLASQHVNAAGKPADRLEAVDTEWLLVRVADAERLIVSEMSISTGPMSRRPCRSMSESIRSFVGNQELPLERLDAFETGAVLHFALPARTTTVQLVTPVGSTGGDFRRLGVAVTGLAIDDEVIALQSPTLVRGFYPLEQRDHASWRWTDGDALLLLSPKHASRSLALAITNWHLAEQD